MTPWVKVDKGKKDIIVPIVVYNDAEESWDLACWNFGVEDVNFLHDDRPVKEFQDKLKKETGKHLKAAFVWLLTRANLERFAPSKSDEVENSEDDSPASSDSESSKSSESSDSKKSEDWQEAETEKKEEKKR